MWRQLGLAGVLLCSVEASMILAAYGPSPPGGVGEYPALVARVLMLLYTFMPLTAVALVLGATPRVAPSLAIDPRRRIMVWLLRAGAVACLLAGIALKIIEARGGARGTHPTLLGAIQDAFPVLLPALFAVLVWACASVILRPADARRSWFRTVLEACGVLQVAPAAVAISDTLPWSAGAENLAVTGVSLLLEAVPSLVLVVVIGRTLGRLRAPAAAA